MKRTKRSLSFACLFQILVICFITGTSYGWGFFAHKWINRMAVRALPDEMRPFFEQHKMYLSEHSIDPDLWRKHDPEEAVRHYIDIDIYGNYPFKELPRSFEEAKRKFGEEALKERGIAPWWVMRRFNQLITAMQQGNPDSISAQAAALGHYVADLYMPLHTVENYDGQLSGNDGIHVRFERWMVEEFAGDIKVTVKKAESIQDPLSFIFDVVLKSYLLSDEIMKADSQAKKPDKDYKTHEDYDQEYFRALFKKVGNLAEQQMSLAASAIGSFWYTAWVEAGKPELLLKNTH
ncbi:MAG: zinc dependent phospholipase C family protein [bacterium]